MTWQQNISAKALPMAEPVNSTHLAIAPGLCLRHVQLPHPPTFTYPWEGWGLTHDAHHLILSDGTSVLHLLDPSTFKPVGKIQVTADGQPVLNLNELEYIHGEIYANIWETNLSREFLPQPAK